MHLARSGATIYQVWSNGPFRALDIAPLLPDRASGAFCCGARFRAAAYRLNTPTLINHLGVKRHHSMHQHAEGMPFPLQPPFDQQERCVP